MTDGSIRTVAVVGLGKMGRPIAANVASAGYSTVGWNRSRVAEVEGVRFCETAAEAVSDADVVLSVLATSDAFDAVFFGRSDELSVPVRRNAVIVDLATVAPRKATQNRMRFARHEINYVDAPMSGSTLAATNRALVFMVGADHASFERVSPLLGSLGAQAVHVGDVGTGMATKLVVNGVVHSLNTALAEAMDLATASGLDRATTYDILEAGAVGAPLTKYKRAQFVDDDTSVAFSIDLMAKDLHLISSHAAEIGASIPLTSVVSSIVAAAQGRGLGAEDMAAIRRGLTSASVR
jgi:3-hydroxyisobutyrate dehydrogenase-like beta-hydroxyacid dehydrogenase